MNLGLRIRNLRENKDFNQKDFAKLLDLNVNVLSRIELGTRPARDDELLKIANCLDVSVDELLGNVNNLKEKSFKIPVFAYVSAGNPLFTNEEIVDWEELPIEYKSQGDFFALIVKGKSMEPRFCEGDVVIVKKQNDVDDGELAIVLVNGDQATFKQVRKSDSGITLIGTNTAVYLPHFYSNEEIESLPVAIIGKVVEARIKF